MKRRLRAACLSTLGLFAAWLALAPLASADIYGAFSRPAASTQPPSGAAIVLSRQNLIVAGRLPTGGGAGYTVDYQPQIESLGKPAPWLLRMTFTATNAPQTAVGFTVVDQTNPLVQGSSAGHVQTSVAPVIGGNITDVPSGTDTSTIQQAVLSGASPGTFQVTLFNGASSPTSYTLQLFPLLGGVLEGGIKQ